MGRAAVVSLVCLLAMGSIKAAAAYPRMVFEREPNDTHEQAQSFRGAAQLAGEVSGDDQDWFRWTLDETEVDQRWRLELRGTDGIRADLLQAGDEPVAAESGVATFGGVTSFASAPPDDAPPGETHAESPNELLTLATSTRSPRVLSDPLLMPAGEHLIRLHADGAGGDYQLTLSADDRVNIRGTLSPERTDRIAVTPGRQWFFQLDVPEAIIPLEAEGKSQQLWQLNLLGELGVPIEAWVENSIGEVIAETLEDSPQHQWGQLALPEGSVLHLRQTQGEPIGRAAISVAEDGLQPAVTTQTSAPEDPEPSRPPPRQ